MPVAEKSVANLIPFKAGYNQNRYVKQKGAISSKTSLEKLLSIEFEFSVDEEKDAILAGVLGVEPRTITAMELMLISVYRKAVLTGDAYTANIILDRLEGKVPNANLNINISQESTEEKLERIRRKKQEILEREEQKKQSGVQ
jgi:hypothetical protein